MLAMFPVGLAVVGRKKTLKHNDGTGRYNEKRRSKNGKDIKFALGFLGPL